jgi:hypothetical protein
MYVRAREERLLVLAGRVHGDIAGEDVGGRHDAGPEAAAAQFAERRGGR